ncbi:curli-like amyloid fiber formation chaperone CsgH [Glycocaulis abyssi]|uniref:Curli-like amyloid fiber formation chaperone CsgH n=1 Tax=Glycocaulis abyssi TaxID=1433403 RepID=A0ABV9NCY2_9PROT
MKRFKGLLVIPALVAAGACAPPPAAGPDYYYQADASALAACWVEFNYGPSGQLLLEAYAAPGLEGSYELDIDQVSSSGNAQISQSGAFSAAGDMPERIHQITLGGNAARRGASLGEMMASMRSAEPGTTVISSGNGDAGVYEVRLRLLDPRGRQICAVERSGP